MMAYDMGTSDWSSVGCSSDLVLQAGPEGAGLMRAAVAFGSVAVAVGLAIRPIERNVGVKMLRAVAVFGAGTVIFGLSTKLLLSLGVPVVMGADGMLSVFVPGRSEEETSELQSIM